MHSLLIYCSLILPCGSCTECGHAAEKLPSQHHCKYHYGCGSGGQRCHRIFADGAGPVYDYRRHFDYPWLPYRRRPAHPPVLFRGLTPHADFPAAVVPFSEPEIIRLDEPRQ